MQGFDVIVTGARVAGSTLAWELARSGYSVLLLDKATFPSDTLSTHNFLSHSMVMLEEMGVREALLRSGAPAYSRAVIQFDDAVIDGRFPEVDGYSDCLCIKRSIMDHILFQHAASHPNVTVMEDFRVMDLLRKGDTVVGVEGVRRSGERLQFGAQLVVGADGRRSKVRELAGSKTLISVPTDFASYVGYFENYRQEGDIHTELYKVGDKLGIVFPTNDGMHVIGVMFPLNDWNWRSKFQKDPGQAMTQIIQEEYRSTPMAERLNTAILSGSVKGLLGYDNDWHQGMGEGWALIGDALTFKDPAVGQGMPDAIYSARILTAVLNSQAGAWQHNWMQMAEAYQQQVEDKMMARFLMACKFTKNVPFTQEEQQVNKLIASSPEATTAFLGIYNHAMEPQQFQEIIREMIK